MATETKIKFRRGPGEPTVGTAFTTGSVGEPLWDTTNEKLYVTNGNTAVLIGPIPQTSLTVIPEYTVGEGGPLLATVTINNAEPILIYAPASTGGDPSTPQTLSVSNNTLTLSEGGKSVDFAGSNGNVEVTVEGTAAVTEGESPANAKFTFSAKVNVIDGGEW